VISATAKVEGAVHADHVIVNGQIHGPVHARELLELQPSAHRRGCLLQGPGNAPGRHHLRKDGPADAVVEEKPTLKWRQTTLMNNCALAVALRPKVLSRSPP
jgi:hypothetical protein